MGEVHLHSAILFGSLLSVLLSDVTSSTLLQSLFEKDVTCFKVTNQKEALSVGVDSNPTPLEALNGALPMNSISILGGVFLRFLLW